jgi:hypothetical protein
MEIHGHIQCGLYIGILHVAEASIKSLGRILGHLHLTYRGASTLLVQAFNSANSWNASTKWSNVLVISPRK